MMGSISEGRVVDPARLHVAAKRYLCAVDPSYRAVPSDAAAPVLESLVHAYGVRARPTPRSAGDVAVEPGRPTLAEPDRAVREAAAARRRDAADADGNPLRQREAAPAARDPLPPGRGGVDADEGLRLLREQRVDQAADRGDIEAVILRPRIRALDVEPVEARPVARADHRERARSFAAAERIGPLHRRRDVLRRPERPASGRGPTQELGRVRGVQVDAEGPAAPLARVRGLDAEAAVGGERIAAVDADDEEPARRDRPAAVRVADVVAGCARAERVRGRHDRWRRGHRLRWEDGLWRLRRLPGTEAALAVAARATDPVVHDRRGALRLRRAGRGELVQAALPTAEVLLVGELEDVDDADVRVAGEQREHLPVPARLVGLGRVGAKDAAGRVRSRLHA